MKNLEKNKVDESLQKSFLKKTLGFRTFWFLFWISIITFLLGFLVSIHFKGLGFGEGLIYKDINNVWNAIFIIGYLLIFTGMLLLLRRFFKKKKRHLVFLEMIAFFFTIPLVLSVFMNYLLAQIITMVLLVLREVIRELYLKGNLSLESVFLWTNNFFLIMAISGAGAFIGLSLGFWPIVIFVFLLCIYDLIAVFLTKHMVVLAKDFGEKKLAFMFSLPAKEKNTYFYLGGGDLAIPLALAVSLFYMLSNIFSMFVFIIIFLVSFLGISLTFLLIKRLGFRALPALPIQGFLCLVVSFLVRVFLF